MKRGPGTGLQTSPRHLQESLEFMVSLGVKIHLWGLKLSFQKLDM